MFRQCGCLGPDMTNDDEDEVEETELDPRNAFNVSDDGIILFSYL